MVNAFRFIIVALFMTVATGIGAAQQASETTDATSDQERATSVAKVEPTSRTEATTRVADWTQWRGPNRDGRVYNQNWPDSLGQEMLTKRWSVPLGPSYSGPLVVGERVFTTETRDKKTEVVRALDRKTGKQIWSTEWKGSMRVPMFAARNGSWIRSTPAYDSGKLYVGGILDVLVCIDAESGKQLWQVDFKEKFGTAKPTFGFVSSPLIDGEHLYIQAGGGFCKLNKATGEVIWRGAVDGGGMMGSAFSSPVLATISGKKQAVIQSRSTLMGIDLENGSELWSQPIQSFRGMNILTPTVVNDSVFVSTYGGSTQMIGIINAGSSFSPRQLWELGNQGYMSSPVIVDNHAYLTLRNKTITCFDLENGVMKWNSPRMSDYSSLITNGEKILALDSSGKLILFEANPDQFVELDSRKVSNNSWAHLAVRGNQIFVRELKAMTVFDWQKAE